MRVSTSYKPIGKKRNNYNDQTYFYMMNNLLYSRLESGLPPNDEYYDEDVNVYLANLLTSIVYPKYHESMAKYIIPYDSVLFENVASTCDPRMKYIIYKSNADFLILSIGIFNNPKMNRAGSVPYMNIPEKAFIGRGKAYYSMAHSYAMEVFRGNTAIGDVLGKLSQHFEKYIKILSFLRSEYFNLYSRISNGELYHLERSIDLIDNEKKLGSLYDEFLDIFSDYKKNKTAELKKQLDEVGSSIRNIDPSFKFDTDQS